MPSLALALLGLFTFIVAVALWLLDRPQRVRLDGSLWASQCPHEIERPE